MTGPSSTPRGERAGKPGAAWETRLVWGGEQIVEDGAPEPRANRAARRAAKRLRGRVGAQEAREAVSAPLSRPKSAPATPRSQQRQNGAQSRHDAPPTERSPE